MTWKTLGGERVEDIVAFVRREALDGRPVHIGTDSLQNGRHTQFVTVLVVLNPPKGGRVVYSREVVPRITSLRERLMREVWRSVEVAMTLADYDLTIHIDANPNERYMSSRYLQELVGLVVGQGFKALWKPDSWASTHAADHIVRVVSVGAAKAKRIRRAG